jgi:hypothetical protein
MARFWLYVTLALLAGVACTTDSERLNSNAFVIY